MAFLDHPADGVPADAPAALARPDDVVAAIGRFLRRLHGSEAAPGAVPVLAEDYLERARRRVAAGAVDPDDLDPPYRPHAPERLLAIAGDLAAGLTDREPPGGSPLVPIHGGLAVADLRLAQSEVVGWRVPEAAVLGDPYADVTFVARDLAWKIGPGAVPAVFDASGLDQPDPVRIEFWITIRQLL